MAKKLPWVGKRSSKPYINRNMLAKCVDVKKIRDWIPEKARCRVPITTAWTIIKNHYCAALVGRGVCPIECANCRETLVSLFSLDDAKNPEALLTWRAKDRSAAKIEDLIAAQKAQPAGLSAEQFPAQETRSALSNNPDPLASLFPKKPADNVFLELESEYQ